MNKILISLLLAVSVGSAYAQSSAPAPADPQGTTPPPPAQLTPEQKAADAFCLRQTGSHLKSMTDKPHSDSAVECANEPGRVYSREDIDRTGAITTRDALRRLDPSIH